VFSFGKKAPSVQKIELTGPLAEMLTDFITETVREKRISNTYHEMVLDRMAMEANPLEYAQTEQSINLPSPEDFFNG